MVKWFLFLLLFYSNPGWTGVSQHSRDFSIMLFTETPNFQFAVRSNDQTGEQIEYKPNTQSADGAQISLGDSLTFSASVKRTPNTKDLALYGNTDYQDFRIQSQLKEFFLSGYYQNYKGFYVNNSSKFDSSLGASDPRMQNQSLGLQNIGLNAFYIFEPGQYSLPAALNQSARQNSSGGSLILGLSISDLVFANDQDLILYSQRSKYGSDSGLEKGHFTALNATLGYGYSFIFWEKFFLSGVLLLGSGVENSTYSICSCSSNINKTTKSGKYDTLISAGFNGDLLFLGISYVNDSTNHITNSLTLNKTLSNVNMHIGVRF